MAATNLNVSRASVYRRRGDPVPESLQLYDSLGRFRDALLVHEWHSAKDATRRARIQTIIGKFSSCSPMLSE